MSCEPPFRPEASCSSPWSGAGLAFATVRHRTVRSKGCLSNKTALAMIFKLAEAAEKSWRRLDGHNQLPKVILGVKFTDGIEVVRSQAQAAAAWSLPSPKFGDSSCQAARKLWAADLSVDRGLRCPLQFNVGGWDLGHTQPISVRATSDTGCRVGRVVVQKYQPTDQRRFVTWLDATFIVGSILAIGMLAMALAGYNSEGPGTEISAAAKIEATAAH
jgi:hypothetical protein